MNDKEIIARQAARIAELEEQLQDMKNNQDISAVEFDFEERI